MLASTIFTAWLLAAPIVSGFTFTAPPKGTKLDLSQNITISWTGENEQFEELDLTFNAVGSSRFGYGIAYNLSSSTGSLIWDPRNVTEALQSTNISLSKGEDHYFEAKLHPNGTDGTRSAGAGLESEKYKITGYPLIGAAAALQPQVGAAVLTVVFISIAFGVL
ncbi:unnamed protein product [Zymoseptoria tritici ST99CH_1A5]|uniref:Ser-Thr-rich glycosyl-phosphatidyl-inositol-anchored membrane family-domain-containing protein n=4 Tax=Zymoseptoria tritici TaxID=1047171 RepID=F9WYP9_ZYMTI|nr:uncharacterized protein MYCGRDRAFT_88743 [Zymoseptoria tritici IPO323]SMQ45044.1 unnamed protein product [Zymoseptoria tritici ST99CH_3D7]SMR41400.1 unnamed protein product [Zymoseptoria tritici ST99CH_1E4]SMR43600.1 unnamed protein product [Zymoseptoria tritici ST99CH_3D1]SMY18744.1 unnamed protein product [Zymoseptoria tritici ST99CH_1A5]EGP90887.1 hypothetical protein MYCGRDRAFT_88743 [Zymoseptoria tritici IPO323]